MPSQSPAHLLNFLHPLPPQDLAHVLGHAADAWRELRGRRLFITGGTGLFGVWLLESICAANRELDGRIRATVLSRNPDPFLARAPQIAQDPLITWQAGDVRDFDAAAQPCDYMVHAATSTSARLNAEAPHEMFETIVTGTRRVLEFGAACGASRLLFVSSGAVYGRQPPSLERVPEDYYGAPDCLDAASAYAEGKRAAELICAMASRRHGPAPCIARCFAFVGPHIPLDSHFAVGNFLGDALAGRDIQVSGDGAAYRSYLHMADLIVWLLTILVRGAPMRAYNVGSDEAVSVKDLAERVLRVSGAATAVRVRQSPTGAPAERYVPAIERAKSELGLRVAISLDGALQRTYQWLVQ
jgi:nucleoside-diphosphate-sugar epimerase